MLDLAKKRSKKDQVLWERVLRDVVRDASPLYAEMTRAQTLQTETIQESAKKDDAIDLMRGLGVLSSPRQRVNALLSLGFSHAEIGIAVGVSGQAVRLWADGSLRPNKRNQNHLDEFRAVALLLVEELNEAAVRAFFCSRPAPGRQPPLDYVHADPQAVGAAAMAQIAYQEELRVRDRHLGDADDVAPIVRELLAEARDDTPAPGPAEPDPPDGQDTVALVDDSHAEFVYERRRRLMLPPNRVR
jgi:hypothetical protein